MMMMMHLPCTMLAIKRMICVKTVSRGFNLLRTVRRGLNYYVR